MGMLKDFRNVQGLKPLALDRQALACARVSFRGIPQSGKFYVERDGNPWGFQGFKLLRQAQSILEIEINRELSCSDLGFV